LPKWFVIEGIRRRARGHPAPVAGARSASAVSFVRVPRRAAVPWPGPASRSVFTRLNGRWAARAVHR
jgi:hypothetical protein